MTFNLAHDIASRLLKREKKFSKLNGESGKYSNTIPSGGGPSGEDGTKSFGAEAEEEEEGGDEVGDVGTKDVNAGGGGVSGETGACCKAE